MWISSHLPTSQLASLVSSYIQVLVALAFKQSLGKFSILMKLRLAAAGLMSHQGGLEGLWKNLMLPGFFSRKKNNMWFFRVRRAKGKEIMWGWWILWKLLKYMYTFNMCLYWGIFIGISLQMFRAFWIITGWSNIRLKWDGMSLGYVSWHHFSKWYVQWFITFNQLP